MSYQHLYGYTLATYTTPVYTQPVYPPQGYPIQPCVSPAYGTGMQPVQTYPVQVHPAQSPPVLEQSIIPDQLLPRPRDTSRRQRSEHEAFEAYGYPLPQSRRNDHSRTDGQHRTRPKQSLHSKKAVAYQDEEDDDDGHAYHSDDDTAVLRAPDEASRILDEYRKEPTASTRPRRVQIEDHSSKPDHVRRYIGSQSASADKQAKGSSANLAGTEREHITNRSTRTPHPEPESKRRPEKPGVKAKERTSTSTAGTGRAHTPKNSSNTYSSPRPKESQSRPKITTNEHEGFSLKIRYDPNHRGIGISIPNEKSTGHRSKGKPKESARAGRRTELTEETVPDYYAIIGCPMDSDAPAISRQIKKKQLEVHPDKRVTSDMSVQEIAEINEQAALVNEAAEVLKDAQRKEPYDQKWRYVYGNTVRR